MDTDPAAEPPREQPFVELRVDDDLVRSRLTVFFRLILAIPVLILYILWSIGAVFVAIAAWFVLLFKGKLSNGMHEFLSGYVRYSTRMNAYVHLVANPWPGFDVDAKYPVDVRIGPPLPQRRWTVAFRIFLVIPAIVLSATSGGLGQGSWRTNAEASVGGAGGTSTVAAILGWFASLARGRMPRGLRDLGAYGLWYSAQTLSYLLLLTDRYPTSDPALAAPMELPEHPVRLEFRDDLSRPRLLVLFRILLALPHLVWLVLWSILGLLASIVGWFATLFMGRLPLPLHRFLAALVRYGAHVNAFLYLVGGPFPGFVGAPGSYPVDVTTPQPERQARWTVAIRIALAIPALALSSAYGSVAFAVGVLGWFSALARGRMPVGMARLGAVAIRYQAQANAYVLLVTPRYPYSAPVFPGAELQDTPPDEPDIVVPAPPAEAF